MADEEIKTPPSRYRPTYRDAEVRLICQYVRRGESLAFVGIAGVGKSNLINFFVQDGPAKNEYLGDMARPAFFPLVNIGTWDHTALGLWNMLLRALATATQGIVPPDEKPVVQLFTEQRLMYTLQQDLRRICRDLAHPVMFILDDSDALFECGPLPIIEELAGLRNEGNRGLLSYLVFTKRLPNVLGRQYDLERQSKFYDLIRHNIYALEPYSSEDALQMLQHMNVRAGKPLHRQELPPIYTLAGGHAQLLKTIFDVRVRQGSLGPDPLAFLVAQADINDECLRVFQGLHEQEQEVAVLIARYACRPEHMDTIDLLARRGLIMGSNPPVWFSPVMERWLSMYPGRTQ